MAIVCLAKVSPLNPATGSRVDLYVSSAQDRSVTGLNGVVWEPALVGAPTLSINLWQGDFKEPIDTGGASFSINMGILKMTYGSADTYNWAGAPVEIYAEEPGAAWPWAERFKGRIASFNRRGAVLSINASIDTEPFDKDILTETYAGTGDDEGGSDLKGRLKPLIIGWAQNVEPVLIDAVNNVYQFSGYGPIEAVSVLYERAADFGAPVADHADYAALVAATIPAGRWATCLAAGMVRLGAPAAGVITGDIRGHKVSTATPRLTGAVINALATIAGVSSGNIEAATLTSLDSAVPYPINLVLTEQVKWRDMAAALALACNWQSGISLTGKWFAAAVTLSGSEVMTLNAQGAALPQVTTSDEADVSVPYYQTVFGANRCWRVHTADEIAFTAQIVPLGLYASGTTYREGNTVELADGSTWLYINATASSGNAPPAWPTSSNLYWSNLTPPTNPASIGAATAAEVAAAYALAQSKGKVWTGPSMPSLAESAVGDTWIGPDGTFYERVNEGGITLAGYAVTLAGFRPQLGWTLSANQVLRDTLAQADAAYASANDAIDELIGLADDNLISRNEKITKLVPEVARLEDKWTALSGIASSLGVSTTSAASARTAWNSFLAGLSPAWNDTSQDTPVTRASFNSVRDAYDTALYDLDRAVKEKAATLANWSGVTGAGKPEDAAEVTSLITGVAAIKINADFFGTITTALPRNQSYALIRNNVDVTTTTSWSVEVISGVLSASIGAATGVLSITTSSGSLTNGIVRITAVYGTTTRTFDVEVVKVIAAAPAIGGSGGTSASSPFSTNINNATMVAVGPELEVTVGSGGAVALAADYTFDVATNGSFDLYARWYRWNGSAYVAIGSEVLSSYPASYIAADLSGESGYGGVSLNDTGLTAASTQKYRLYMRTPSGTVSRTINGTITAVGS